MRFSGFLLSAFFLLTCILVSGLNNKEYEEAVMAVEKINKSALLTVEKKPKRHELKNYPYKLSQVWLPNDTRRHRDTVPMRRSTNGDHVMRANSVSELGKKQYPFYRELPELDVNYEYAIAWFKTTTKVYGAQAIINLWKPLVYGFDHSTTQMLIKYGDSDSLNVIEVGWHAYPSLYGDNKARLFISWTKDSYGQSGCYNYFCEGFVDTSNTMDIGKAFDSVSQASGSQRYMDAVILKDPRSGNWRLMVNDIEKGFWPANIFANSNSEETNYEVDWGGVVYRVPINGQYKSTQMGSGEFPEEGFQRASYLKSLKVAVSSDHLSLVEPRDLSTSVTDERCYNISTPLNPSGFDTSFYFGGPATNLECL